MHSNTAYAPLISLVAYTGIRRSEVLALRWKDVDLLMGNLSVNRAVHHLRNREILYSEPKSAKARRVVALSPRTVIELRNLREKQEAERILLGSRLAEDDLIFSHIDGSPLRADTITHAFLKIARGIGLKGVRFHDLRHTHASLMLKAGVHPKIVQERLGHSSIALTLDTYSHVMPGLQEKAALAFEEGLALQRKGEAKAEAVEKVR